MSLSSAGRDFLGSAESVLRHVRAAESAAADVRNRAAGLAYVGVLATLFGLVKRRVIEPETVR